MRKEMILTVVRENLDYRVKVSKTHWGEFLELLRDGGNSKGTRVAFKFEESAGETLCNEILGKVIEYNELYNRYLQELNSSQVNLLGRQITGLKRDLKNLEVRLASLEQREPRNLPLRPLPVRFLGVD